MLFSRGLSAPVFIYKQEFKVSCLFERKGHLGTHTWEKAWEFDRRHHMLENTRV